MKPYIAACILLVLSSFCYQPPDGWTPAKEKQIFDFFYRSADSLFASESQKKTFALCVVSEIKKLHPEGIPKNSSKSMEEGAVIGRKCAESVKITFAGWTPQMIELLKKRIVAGERFKDLDDEAKNKIADCLIDKIKTTYPDGVKEKIPDAVLEDILSDCYKSL